MNGWHYGIRDRVTASYDKKYNEIYFNIFKKDNLVYNEDQQVFTSVYDSVDGDVYYLDINALKLSIATSNVSNVYEENKKASYGSEMFGKDVTPSVTFIANQPENMVKVFDITTFGGHFDNKDSLSINYNTPHGQSSTADGKDITDREWDYRVAIPRNDNADYGNRLRDKTIECTLSSSSNSDEFSLEYVITKYRLSWS